MWEAFGPRWNGDPQQAARDPARGPRNTWTGSQTCAFGEGPFIVGNDKFFSAGRVEWGPAAGCTEEPKRCVVGSGWRATVSRQHWRGPNTGGKGPEQAAGRPKKNRKKCTQGRPRCFSRHGAPSALPALSLSAPGPVHACWV